MDPTISSALASDDPRAINIAYYNALTKSMEKLVSDMSKTANFAAIERVIDDVRKLELSFNVAKAILDVDINGRSSFLSALVDKNMANLSDFEREVISFVEREIVVEGLTDLYKQLVNTGFPVNLIRDFKLAIPEHLSLVKYLISLNASLKNLIDLDMLESIDDKHFILLKYLLTLGLPQKDIDAAFSVYTDYGDKNLVEVILPYVSIDTKVKTLENYRNVKRQNQLIRVILQDAISRFYQENGIVLKENFLKPETLAAIKSNTIDWSRIISSLQQRGIKVTGLSNIDDIDAKVWIGVTGSYQVTVGKINLKILPGSLLFVTQPLDIIFEKLEEGSYIQALK